MNVSLTRDKARDKNERPDTVNDGSRNGQSLAREGIGPAQKENDAIDQNDRCKATDQAGDEDLDRYGFVLLLGDQPLGSLFDRFAGDRNRSTPSLSIGENRVKDCSTEPTFNGHLLDHFAAHGARPATGIRVERFGARIWQLSEGTIFLGVDDSFIGWRRIKLNETATIGAFRRFAGRVVRRDEGPVTCRTSDLKRHFEVSGGT